MQAKTKTILIVLGSIASVFIVPAVIIICHDYLNAFFAITSFVLCFVLVGYYSYQDLLPILEKEQREEEQIIHCFNGDKDKIRFYKGFKKHFDGDLNLKELEQWLKSHPHKD